MINSANHQEICEKYYGKMQQIQESEILEIRRRKSTLKGVSISFGLFGSVSTAGLVKGELGHGRTGHGHQHAHLQHHPHVVLHSCHSDNFKGDFLLKFLKILQEMRLVCLLVFFGPPKQLMTPTFYYSTPSVSFLRYEQSPIPTPQVPCLVQISRRSFFSHTRLVFSLNAGPGLRTRLIFWMRGAPSSIWFASINIWIIHHKHSSSPAKRPSSSSNWVQLRLESYDSEWFLL